MLSAREVSWLLENYKNPLVRIDPKANGYRSGPGWMRAQLLGLEENYAIVQPMGHKRTERIEPRFLSHWHSKNELNGPLKSSFAELITKPRSEEKIHEPSEEIKHEMDKVEVIVNERKKPGTKKGQKHYPRHLIERAMNLKQSGLTYDRVSEETGIGKRTLQYHWQRRNKRDQEKGADQRLLATTASPIRAQSEDPILSAVRGVLQLKIGDTAKLMAIEALLS